MPGKRLIAALVILTFLAACVSDPARDDSASAIQVAPQSSGTSTSAGPDGKAVNGDSTANPDANQPSHGGGCCGGGLGNLGNGDPRILLAFIVVVAVAVAAVVVYHLAVETIDSIRHHTQPASKDATEGGVYRDPNGLFSVAIPVGYPAQGEDTFEVRQSADNDQQQVFFITAKEEDPVYGISIQSLASRKDAAMPLTDFATKIYPPPKSGDSALLPLYQQDLTLNGKPALFREYSPGPGPDGKHPMYYLLYFMRDAKHSAVLSITWPRDCPNCSSGPEAAIRGTDSELKKFVESFHMTDTVRAVGEARRPRSWRTSQAPKHS